ncbi:MAG: potassium transporter TrkG, partial [Eubacteriales bacterium]|nr:potassium transporter TrkG [Eubacteriales bacterium]
GYATADFAAQWPQFSRHLLVLLMIIGACAGSTGGGLKVSRLIILVKTFFSEVRRTIHPRMVSTIHMDGKALSSDTIQGTRAYFTIYMLVIFVSTLLLSVKGPDFTTNLTAELACFNNIGPGIGLVGPMGNYAMYSPFAKMLLSLNMLLGRLEIFPLLVLFSPSVWRKTAA